MLKWNFYTKTMIGVFIVIGLLGGVTMLGKAQNNEYKLALPFVPHDYVPCPEKNPKKGVAWAYGRQNIHDEERLCISAYHVWGLLAEGTGYAGLEHFNVFWSDIYTSPTGESHNYFDDLEARLGNDYDGILLFLNEPELDDQANKMPTDGAQLYLDLKAQCPDCQLYGPMVSAHDHLCKDDPNQLPYYDDLQAKYDNWCWFREWWSEVERLSGEPPQMDGYTIHHTLGREEGPIDPINSLQATVASLGDLRPFKVIVSEYAVPKNGDEASCDADFMAEMTDAYNQDPRVEYFFAFTPNLVESSAWCTLFEPFGSAHFTRTGMAFASHGNR